MKLIIRIIVTLALVSIAASAQAEFENFFPSSQIHEDDSFDDLYELEVNGCKFIVTRRSVGANASRYFYRYVFDLRDFETDPDLMFFSYTFPGYSSRHFIFWAPVNQTVHRTMIDMDKKLWNLRISYNDRKLSQDQLLQKSQIISDFSEEIKAGKWGAFNKNNYIERYTPKQNNLLVGFSIVHAIYLPVRGGSASKLIEEMHAYKLANCPPASLNE